MLWSEAVTNIRSLLQDQLDPKRYSDNDVRMAVNNGLMMAFRLRPDLFLTDLIPVPIKATDIEDPDYPIAISDMYADALCEHAAGWMMLRDDEYNADGRAAFLLAQYRSALRGTPSAGVAT